MSLHLLQCRQPCLPAETYETLLRRLDDWCSKHLERAVASDCPWFGCSSGNSPKQIKTAILGGQAPQKFGPLPTWCLRCVCSCPRMSANGRHVFLRRVSLTVRPQNPGPGLGPLHFDGLPEPCARICRQGTLIASPSLQASEGFHEILELTYKSFN